MVANVRHHLSAVVRFGPVWSESVALPVVVKDAEVCLRSFGHWEYPQR